MSKLYRVFLGILALSMVLLGGCAGNKTDEMADSTPGTGEITEPSAEPIVFEGTDLEGNAVSSDLFSQSKLTMINVWATNCNPCLREMPALGELASEYEAEEFQIIGIVGDVLEGEDQALVESLVAQTGANYTHLLLNESIYYALLTDVASVPTTFFLDEDGIILDTVVGAKEKTEWEEIVDALLEE